MEGDGYETEQKKGKIKSMEGERNRILKETEEKWTLKSRAIWLEVGDENSKFFQNYAKGRRNKNTIWEMKKFDWGSEFYFNDLVALGVGHFKTLFKAPPEATIAEVIQVERVSPIFFEEEDNDILMDSVTKGEVDGVLKSIQKEKIPVPNG